MCLTLLPQSVLAHNPTNMVLEYDFSAQRLNVTITHNVADPNNHYIENVKIWRNDNLIINQDYTSQPSTSSFTYSYDITAVDGDVLRATGTCSISGSITRQITVVAPKPPGIDLSVNPTIATIDENSTQDFTITITSNDQTLDGTTVTITAEYGTITNQNVLTGGKYEFTYSAPEVTQDITETVNITGTKSSYNPGYIESQFVITNQIPPNGNDINLDGIINDDEYEFSASFSGGDYKLHWRLVGETLSMAVEGKTSGWVAIGFEPKKRMKDADMIFGWVSSGVEVKVVDTYSENETGPHPPDTDLGGTDDILEFGGSEKNGWTIIEFKRLLETGDEFDNKLRSKGDIDIIWAMGSNDNFENKHSQVGSGTINLATGESSEDIKLWPFHAFFMILGFIFMVKASVIAHFKKKIKWWLKAHRAINIFATIFAILGLLMGIYMVAEVGGTHFGIPHAYIGLITIIFVIITSVLGFKMLNPQSPSKKLRVIHRAIGRITIILMLVNILIGLSIVGII